MKIEKKQVCLLTHLTHFVMWHWADATYSMEDCATSIFGGWHCSKSCDCLKKLQRPKWCLLNR